MGIEELVTTSDRVWALVFDLSKIMLSIGGAILAWRWISEKLR